MKTVVQHYVRVDRTPLVASTAAFCSDGSVLVRGKVTVAGADSITSRYRRPRALYLRQRWHKVILPSDEVELVAVV